MSVLFAMTLPALVVGLFVLGVLELVAARRGHGRHRGTAMSSTGFDLVQEVFAPTRRYAIEQREHEALMMQEEGDGAPPRSRIDLERGTAYLVVPKS